ncbi:MAG: hypothetical protein ACKOPN_06020, partial [Prochlorococcaceae cyanobacterium]
MPPWGDPLLENHPDSPEYRRLMFDTTRRLTRRRSSAGPVPPLRPQPPVDQLVLLHHGHTEP